MEEVITEIVKRIRKLEVQEIGPAAVPIGAIILWSGAVVDIPDSYQICDGTNDTPDLRNMFVVGAGDTYAVGDTATFAAGATFEYYALAYIMRMQ